MTDQRCVRSILAQLDHAELLAMRENIQAAARIEGGPPARRMPESLCAEIETLIELLEQLVVEAQIEGNNH